MIAWAVTATLLLMGFALVAPLAPAAAPAWRVVTRAFVVAPLTLVVLTILLSFG